MKTDKRGAGIMKSASEFIHGITTAFFGDVEAALERIFMRILGRMPTVAEMGQCERFTLTNSSAVAFVFRGKIILLSGGVDLSLLPRGKVSWWIKEMA